jgi:hypothetical protein
MSTPFYLRKAWVPVRAAEVSRWRVITRASRLGFKGAAARAGTHWRGRWRVGPVSGLQPVWLPSRRIQDGVEPDPLRRG